MKRLVITTTAAGALAAACLIIPTGIAGASGSAPTNTVSSTLPRQFDLGTAKAEADAAIQQRLASIDLLGSRLAKVTHGECQGAAMASQLTADTTGLTDLKGQIDALPAGTTARDFKALAEQITRNYRVYALETPKAVLVMACDKVLTAADRFDEVIAKVQAADPSLDLSTVTNDVQTARDDAAKAVNAVIGLVADKGDAGVAASNKTAILQARLDMRAAVKALHDARQALKDLRS